MYRHIFGFFSALRLAVILLVSLAIVLAVGTIYESLYDAETARYYIYGTWWFISLLALLGLNVLFAALSRYPWKRHHTGFVVVHLGIILILIGSSITLIKGYEGQLIIAEGETRDRIFLKDPLLYFYDQQTGRLDQLKARFRFDPPRVEKPFKGKVLGDIHIKVDQYLPNTQKILTVKDGNDLENPALQIRLVGSRATVDDWVFSREFTKQRLALGPASITFLEVPDLKVFSRLLSEKKYRGPVLWAEGELISLKGNMGKEIRLGDQVLFFQNLAPHGVVEAGRIVNLSSKPENPVLKLSIQSEGKEVTRNLFAKYPNFSDQHQKALIEDIKLRLLWIPEKLGELDNELVLAQDPQGKLFYSLKGKGKWGEIHPLILKEEIPTGWMDFKFSVIKLLNKAKQSYRYRRVIVPKGKQGPSPAVHLIITRGGENQEIWIGRGESREVSVGSRNIKVAYALKSIPLGFKVRLDDFQMGIYEGTTNPSEYKSQITLIDPKNNLEEAYLIEMNEPLVYGKYKTFQASYQLNPDGPDWSVLSVAYDPGIFTKYLGSIILVLGIILIFFFRPAFLKKKKKISESKENQPEAISFKKSLSPPLTAK